MTRSKKVDSAQYVDVLKSKIASVNAKQQMLNSEKSAVADDAMDLLKSLISKTPYIKAIRWAQYTPTFNDGDVCEFGINNLEFLFDDEFHSKPNKTKNNQDDEDDLSDADFLSDWLIDAEFFLKKKDLLNYKDVDLVEEVSTAIGEIHTQLGNSSTLLEARFGDDVRITVTKNGVETEEYCDHE